MNTCNPTVVVIRVLGVTDGHQYLGTYIEKIERLLHQNVFITTSLYG